jgi:hypothetical protein
MNLVSFARMEQKAHGLDLLTFHSKSKKTSAWFTMDTATLTPLVKPDAPLYNMSWRIDYFSGGVVIKDNAGEVIELLDKRKHR